ncbi:hypothetical protein AB5I41_25740 [Sphingomonas sp. MMS24-JH45]
MRAIRTTFDTMLAEERRLLAMRDAGLRRTEHAFYIVLGVAALLLATLGAIAWVTILTFTRDLTHSRDQLAQLNDSLEAIVVVERTSDLTRANDEIQRFAYIVSHDLRSPLVNVMGFTAELKVLGANSCAPSSTAPMPTCPDWCARTSGSPRNRTCPRRSASSAVRHRRWTGSSTPSCSCRATAAAFFRPNRSTSPRWSRACAARWRIGWRRVTRRFWPRSVTSSSPTASRSIRCCRISCPQCRQVPAPRRPRPHRRARMADPEPRHDRGRRQRPRHRRVGP